MAEKTAGEVLKGKMLSATTKKRLKARSGWKPGGPFSKNTGPHVA